MPESNPTFSSFKTKLEKSPVARAKFVASVVDMLEKNGIDANEKVIIDRLFSLDFQNGKKFVDGLAASSAIITITH